MSQLTEKAEIPFSLKEKLEKLRSDLETANPGFGSVLSEIHSITKQNPEFVYGLTDEELQTIFLGLSKYSNLSLETTKKKGKGKSEKMIISVDDI